MRTPILVAVALLAAWPTLATAHQIRYTAGFVGDTVFWQEGGQGNTLSSRCEEGNNGPVFNPDLYFGGICYRGGHITPFVPPGSPPGTPGTTRITLTDDRSAAVNALFCHDLNGNAICGEAGEPRSSFCSTILLTEGATTWIPANDIIVFTHGVRRGTEAPPVLVTPCGSTNYATDGVGEHTSS